MWGGHGTSQIRKEGCTPSLGATPAQGCDHPGNKILVKGPMALGPRRLTSEGVSLSGSVRTRWRWKEASKRHAVASASAARPPGGTAGPSPAPSGCGVAAMLCLMECAWLLKPSNSSLAAEGTQAWGECAQGHHPQAPVAAGRLSAAPPCKDQQRRWGLSCTWKDHLVFAR